MAYPALALSALAAVLAVLPGEALFVAMAAGIAGLALGLGAYRDRRRPSGQRVWGGAAAGLGGLALAACGLRYVLILLAIGRLERMLG